MAEPFRCDESRRREAVARARICALAHLVSRSAASSDIVLLRHGPKSRTGSSFPGSPIPGTSLPLSPFGSPAVRKRAPLFDDRTTSGRALEWPPCTRRRLQLLKELQTRHRWPTLRVQQIGANVAEHRVPEKELVRAPNREGPLAAWTTTPPTRHRHTPSSQSPTAMLPDS